MPHPRSCPRTATGFDKTFIHKLRLDFYLLAGDPFRGRLHPLVARPMGTFSIAALEPPADADAANALLPVAQVQLRWASVVHAIVYCWTMLKA